MNPSRYGNPYFVMVESDILDNQIYSKLSGLTHKLMFYEISYSGPPLKAETPTWPSAYFNTIIIINFVS